MKHALTLVCILLFLSCTKPNRQINEITKVELARSGAWSDAGAAISIDSSLTFKYYDGNSKKYYVGKVGENFWDTLNKKFAYIDFKTIPVTDNKNGIADAEYFELIVSWKAGKRRMVKLASLGHNSLDQTFLWLNFSYKNVKLNKVITPIKFETTYQNQPKIDQVKFPPPIPKKFKKHKNN